MGISALVDSEDDSKDQGQKKQRAHVGAFDDYRGRIWAASVVSPTLRFMGVSGSAQRTSNRGISMRLVAR